MKKVLAIVLAAVMVLGCNMTAFAQIMVDGTTRDNPCEVATAEYVSVDGIGDQLTVTGDVTFDRTDVTPDPAIIYGGRFTEINIGGNVTDNSTTHAIYANGSNVKVNGNVNEMKDGNAIYAYESTVTVGGSVIENGGGNAIDTINSTVKVGSVTENGDGDAIHANNSKVTVVGDVTGNGDGVAICIKGSSTIDISKNVFAKNGTAIEVDGTASNSVVKVAGNVTAEGEWASAVSVWTSNNTVVIGGDVFATGVNANVVYINNATATTIIEGTANGKIDNGGGELFLGSLNGDIKNIDDDKLNHIHYLIGTQDGQNDKINVIGEIVSTETKDGVNKNGYYYTTTADSAALSGKSFLIKSTVSDKKMKIEGEYPNVTITPNEDGTYTLTIGENFKGGIQALNVIFEDIAKKISGGGGSTRTINTGSKGNPVTNGKWTQNADGTWSYATSVKFTNDWAFIAKPGEEGAAAWYRFDRNGNMLTGWQKIFWNGSMKWFYFIEAKGDDEGKCLMNGTTPDGHKVGPDGAWIEN